MTAETVTVRIKEIEPIAVSLPMVKPVIMAGEEIRRADNLLVRIETDNGLVGWGEAGAAPMHTGESSLPRPDYRIQRTTTSLKRLTSWIMVISLSRDRRLEKPWSGWVKSTLL